MTDTHELLVNIKRQIKAFLTTYQQGCILSQFKQDYNKEIPFKELGYQRLEDFLRSIPDIIQVIWCVQANDFILKAVVDEKTDYLSNLMQKKRPSKQNILKAYRKPPRGTKYTTPLQNYEVPPRFSKNVSVSRFEKSEPLVVGKSKLVVVEKPKELSPPVRDMFFAQLKDEVLELVRSQPEGIITKDFCSVYKERYKKDFNYQVCGFEMYEECLEQVSGIQAKKINGQVRVVMQDIALPRSAPPSASIMPLQPYPSSLTETKKLYIWAVTDELSEDNEVEGGQKIVDDDQDNRISATLKQNFKELLARHQRGIWGADFLRAYQVQFKEDLNLQELGFYSLVELTDSLPDIFRRERPENCKSDWLLFDASLEINKPLPSKEPEVVIHIPSSLGETVANIRKILQAIPEGIYLDELINMYTLNCGEPPNCIELCYKKLKCESLEDFLKLIDSDVPLKFDYGNVRPKIFLAYDNTKMPRTLKFSDRGFMQVPADAVLPGETYTIQSLPNSLKKGVYFPIYTSIVIDPGLIWMQLKGPDTSESLKYLTEELDTLYSSSSREYVMQPQHIKIGAACAGVWDYDGSWYRVSIISVTPGNTVRVTFVDYGNFGIMRKINLRYLKKRHMQLPAQAIKSRLAFIAPLHGDQWEIEVREKVVEFCKNKTLMAEVIPIHCYPDFVSLWVCDSTGEDDVYLNKWLVDQKLAVYFEEDTSNTVPYNAAATTPAHVPVDVPSTDELLKAVITAAKFHKAMNDNNNCLSSLLSSLSIGESQPSNVIEQQLSSSLNSRSDPTAASVNPMQRLTTFNHLSIMQNPYCYQNTAYSADSVSNSTVNDHAPPYGQENVLNNLNSTPPTMSLSAATGSHYVATEIVLTPVETSYALQVADEDCEMISEDDDETFERLCVEMGCVQRFVKRVNLQQGYRIHVVLVNNMPFVTSGDIAYLFWPNDNHTCLQRRVCQKGLSDQFQIIAESDYEVLFQQLRCLNVRGIATVERPTLVVLYHLKTVINLLNVFGHPSPTIRYEVYQELCQFDPESLDWRVFSNEPSEDDEASYDTDTDKFKRMCAFDLDGLLSSLRFKRLKIQKELVSNPANRQQLLTELSKINIQYELYEKRMKEIEAITETFVQEYNW